MDRIIYHDPMKPFVRCWFISSDADNVNEFNRLLSIKNQMSLQKERGVCIVSTHFGKGFVKNGKVHDVTRKLLEAMSERNGWFVPVSTVLDFLAPLNASQTISYKNRLLLEAKWLLHSLSRNRRALTYEKTEIDYLA